MANLFLSNEKLIQTFGTLLGLINGISADGVVNEREVKALETWLKIHESIHNRKPFNEVFSAVISALADGQISPEEVEDIRFVCLNILKHYNAGSEGELHGLAAGIASDRVLNDSEWNMLREWISSNRALKGSWPFDEIDLLLGKHESISKMTAEEREIIVHYFNDFCGFNKNLALTIPLNEPGKAITSICAICPEIEVHEKVFCITGDSRKYARKEITDMIFNQGGVYKTGVSKLVDYLVVCEGGSPMWIYSCHGRKIEQAMTLLKAGHHIQLIRESDLWDYFEEVA